MILFMIRGFNDIDHFTPVIHNAAARGRFDIQIWCANPNINLSDDSRLSFLRRRHGIRTRHLSPWIRRWLYRSRLRDAVFDKSWATSFLQNTGASRLVFDWVNPQRWVYGSLNEAATEMGLTKLAIPHGMTLMLDDDFDGTGGYQRFGRDFDWLDRIGVPGRWMLDQYVRGGFPQDRLSVLGSARYDPDWLTVYRTQVIPGEFRDFAPGGRLKVLYIDHDRRYRLSTEQIVSDLRAIARIPATVIVKHHTRAQLSDPRLAKAPLRLVTETPTYHLIEWADVVLSTISSVVVDAMQMGKLFIFPRYWTENKMLFDSMSACHTARDHQELLAFVSSCTPGKCRPNYDPEPFLTEAVWGGSRSRPIADRYYEFVFNDDRVRVG